MSRLPLLGLAAAGLLLLILCSAAPAKNDTVNVLTIADTTGDWGFPSPRFLPSGQDRLAEGWRSIIGFELMTGGRTWGELRREKK